MGCTTALLRLAAAVAVATAAATLCGAFSTHDYHADEDFANVCRPPHRHQRTSAHPNAPTHTHRAQAFDIALMDAIADGTVDSILDRHGIPTQERVRDCSSLANKWPAVPRSVLADNRTTFGSVFAHGALRLCARTIDEGSRGRYVPNNVSGSLPEIERDVARRIGAHYNYTGTLGVQYVWFESSEEVMPALDAGECDATYALIAVGGFSGGLRRAERWRPSCAVLGDVVTLYVNASGPATLDAFLARYDSPAIGTIGLAALQFCPQLIIDSKTVSFLSDDAAYAALRAGTIHGFLGSTNAAAFPDVRAIATPYYITRAAWFRKEQTTDMKVTHAADLQQYMTGNEDLALTYEAALNAISQQTVTARIFSRFGISRLDTLVCFSWSSPSSLPFPHLLFFFFTLFCVWGEELRTAINQQECTGFRRSCAGARWRACCGTRRCASGLCTATTGTCRTASRARCLTSRCASPSGSASCTRARTGCSSPSGSASTRRRTCSRRCATARST